jgi:hypothetical protein
MPVSKKRKKEGKPVHRKVDAPPSGEAHPPGPEAAPAPVSPTRMAGRPSNPFVAQQTRRASQRGR